MGRPWQMPEGNLAMSGLIRPQQGEGNLAELGFVAALALDDVLSRLLDPALLQLKWPNDILLHGAKLSGILLEREGDLLIVGIGVNLAVAPPVPGRPTVALCDHGPKVPARLFAEDLARAFAVRRAQWRDGGFAATRAAWLLRAHPIGTPLWVTGPQAALEGRFAGIAPDGALLLEGADGVAHTIHAGDVWGSPPLTRNG